MKNILLGPAFVLLLLPQVSFGATTPVINTTPPISPLQASCNQQQGVTAQQFFQQQVNERNNFGKQYPTNLANHDKNFQAGLAIDLARRQGKPTANLPAPTGEDPVFASFQQKQQNDKGAFFGTMAQDMQKCLSGTSSAFSFNFTPFSGPTSPTTGTTTGTTTTGTKTTGTTTTGT